MMLRLVPANCKGKMARPRMKLSGQVEGEIPLLAERNWEPTVGDWAGYEPDARAKDRPLLRSRVRLVSLRFWICREADASYITNPQALGKGFQRIAHRSEEHASELQSRRDLV